jgi:hypothetical protein
MAAFERVLMMAKHFDPFTQADGTDETINANTQALELVEKWIERQKKARGWDKDAGREQTPSS